MIIAKNFQGTSLILSHTILPERSPHKSLTTTRRLRPTCCRFCCRFRCRDCRCCGARCCGARRRGARRGDCNKQNSIHFALVSNSFSNYRDLCSFCRSKLKYTHRSSRRAYSSKFRCFDMVRSVHSNRPLKERVS